jgi:hypothetical protein
VLTSYEDLSVKKYNELINKARGYWIDERLDEYDFVLLLPGADDALNERINAAFEAKLHGAAGISIHGEAARQLTTLYSLYGFSDKVLIGSFDEPYGRKLRNLLDSGVAAKDELIDDVILGTM